MKKRILLVDDDPKLSEITRELLELDGYEVAMLDGPFGTSRAIAEHRPALVLLDVNMPGLSGDSLAALLKRGRGTGGTKIVLYSSNDEEALRMAAESAGADGYVCKGSGAELRRRVARWLS